MFRSIFFSLLCLGVQFISHIDLMAQGKKEADKQFESNHNEMAKPNTIIIFHPPPHHHHWIVISSLRIEITCSIRCEYNQQIESIVVVDDRYWFIIISREKRKCSFMMNMNGMDSLSIYHQCYLQAKLIDSFSLHPICSQQSLLYSHILNEMFRSITVTKWNNKQQNSFNFSVDHETCVVNKGIKK